MLTKNRAVAAAIDSINENAWTPVRYPGAVRDPDTGTWISDAEVAEVPYTAFASTPHAVRARLIVRRVKDARYPDALFPVWRHHPFFTDTTEPVDAADITHRRHAPSKPCSPTSSTDHWPTCLRGELGLDSVRRDRSQPAARGRHPGWRCAHGGPQRDAAPSHRQRPARLARPQRRPILHLPSHWPWAQHWLALWRNTIGHSPPATATT